MIDAAAQSATVYPGYPDMAAEYGWTRGVHRAPEGYQHPWLIVTSAGTFGAWSREQARRFWVQVR